MDRSASAAADMEQQLSQFRQEVELLASCRCQNVVLLVGFCCERMRSTAPDRGSSYYRLAIVTEFMPRGSLWDNLHRRTTAFAVALGCIASRELRASLARVALSLTHARVHCWGGCAGRSQLSYPRRMRMLLDVIKGMQYLEAAQIVHRDLKSQNLLVDRSFRVKVADFGLARLSYDSHVQTQHGAAGTPAWMAPEVSHCCSIMFCGRYAVCARYRAPVVRH
eukprot:COSAG01_NODE_17227_length_1168_cov_1.217025_2_plen_222_part_00